MSRLIRCALAVALGLGTLQASAESDQNRGDGQISYVNPATLEIGIDDRLFRLDSGFVVHGFKHSDRARQISALRPGMNIEYVTTGPGDSGTIKEIRIRAD